MTHARGVRTWRAQAAARVALCLLVGVALFPRAARAQEDQGEELLPLEEALDQEQRLQVIQNRKYTLDHEITVMLGSMPVDPYYKGYTVNVGYTWHFSELLAWEGAQFTYSFNVDTKLKQEILRVALATGNTEVGFAQLEWMFASRIVFKPLYGKQAIFNTEVVHVEAFLTAGPNVMYVQNVRGRRDTPRDRLTGGFEFGGGLRLFLEQWVSLRVDLSEHIFFGPVDVFHALHVRFGAAFNLGLDA